MNGDYYIWQKLKRKNTFAVEDMLRNIEDDYVCACGRFLVREAGRDSIWTLSGKRNELIKAIIINSKSTLIPVLCGIKEIPEPKFINSLIKKKNIHSVQGLAREVSILEAAMERYNKKPIDAYDYDLMELNKPLQNQKHPSNLVLRVPRLTDLDALAPLQAGYEHEEVLPKGSVFSPAASRVNLANIVAGGKILAAELNGKLIGKINVSAKSFTRYLVGGVYVHPDFRGLGIAKAMASAFITSLINDGMGVTLFVKKPNLAARKLYLALGFTVRGDYRIAYY